jgi:hypothetical protein
MAYFNADFLMRHLLTLTINQASKFREAELRNIIKAIEAAVTRGVQRGFR